MLRVSRSIHFSASLRYRLEDLDDEENFKRFGRQTNRHGHNYRLEITVRGEPDPSTGMIINLTKLKEVAQREIMARFDHKDLNRDTDYFLNVPPTPENLGMVIFRLLDAALPAGMLDRIRLYQTPDLFVDVVGTGP